MHGDVAEVAQLVAAHVVDAQVVGESDDTESPGREAALVHKIADDMTAAVRDDDLSAVTWCLMAYPL